MTAHLSEQQIKHDLQQIASIDQELTALLEQYGYPPPRIRPHGFETLLAIIAGQQISTAAAAAIMRCIRILLPELKADALLALPEGALRQAGLSARKVEYATGMAQAIVDGGFEVDSLPQLSDDDAIKAITRLRGFGTWSAEIYLMFALQRRDIFPAGDLALQVALQRLKGLETRPDAKQARLLTQHWSPWRSAGSLFLWHYYRGTPA